ncbi:MAG: YicC/YloC family endoribonuclease [Ekhidna sp.]
MQHSMTGYGRDERTNEKFLIKSEVKTLNSKFLDFSPRMPKELSFKEAEIRNLVSDYLKRGKVVLNLEFAIINSSESTAHVDADLFKAYYKKFQELASSVQGAESDLTKLAIQAPDVIKQQEIAPDDLPWDTIVECIKSSLEKCIEFRENEGTALEEKLKEYISNISDGLKSIAAADSTRSESIRSRIHKNLEEIKEKVQIDENRFEQEIIYYLEKIDITEEKVRLKQHLDYFMEIITKDDVAGKKLGFIAQEIGREINTIGSKANDASIQKTVVMMKDELEKIKEQTLNIL